VNEEPFIKIDGLTKQFEGDPQKALDTISASFQAGQMIGLVGPDGAGKTTLIRLMAGLLLPTAGRVVVSGIEVATDSSKLHEMIGYMPQRFGLYEDLTVMENMNLYADLQGLVGKDKESRFERLLHFAGLTPFTDRLAKNLSGGMKQKLGLICSLMRMPRLLLLDEPSVGVDPISRRELWSMVEELVVKEKITIIWSTSYLDEAEKCAQVMLLNKGKLLYTGEPGKLLVTMEGKTFLLKGIKGERREALHMITNSPEVLDAVVQGSSVRVVLKEKDKLPHLNALGPTISWEPTPPRFEDAFINMLGGCQITESKLAENISTNDWTSENMIHAEGLTKKFGTFTAVDHISFQIRRGEIFGLLGPNGAGKSTTFKMLCGLLQPDSGECTVRGLSLQKASSQARGQIGYMSQKFSLYGNMTVEQNLTFFSGIYPIPSRDLKKRVRDAIDIFEMQDLVDTSSATIPLGFQRRLALACATMHHPPVLFLDEPTSGVDPVTRREFWVHINGLVTKGVTVMVTTHFMDEAEYCDRIALINEGKLLTIGTPDDLKAKAKSPQLPSPTLEDAFIYLSRRSQ
jgi:ABC-2 type transport system ATP-binding protein